MNNKVKEYYNENYEREWDRLLNPYSKVEFLSTLYLIDKYFPKNGHIADIGSGPGRYSIQLLKKGYKVTLFELSNKELDLAKETIEKENLKAEAYICEDALNLHLLPSDSFHAVLLMGPLYHILDSSSREKILNETYRILKPNGVAIIAYINSFGILKAGVTEFSNEFEDINNIYLYLKSQKFSHEESFTKLYTTTPEDALNEIKKLTLKFYLMLALKASYLVYP
ncbi:MAG: class I SAM-dependent methyltransferase [Clostridium sp.]